MALQLVHITDGGVVRATNQDSFCVRIATFQGETVSLLVVCDGMGGMEAGELASTCAVRGFENWFEMILPKLLHENFSQNELFVSWHQLLEELHARLTAYADAHRIQLGTTVSALLLARGTGYIAQIGDSRIYLDDTQKCVQLTKDQTVAMREYEAGRLSLNQLATDAQSSVLLQCLGAGTMQPAFCCTALPVCGAVLLCSDGFYHTTSPEKIHQVFEYAADREQLRQGLCQLVQQCRMHGETDNITAVALRWDAELMQCGDPQGTFELLANVSGEAATEEYERELGGCL